MRCSLILFMYIALVRTSTRATLYILVYGMKIVMLLKVRIFFVRVLIKAKLEYLKSIWKHGSTRYTLFFFFVSTGPPWNITLYHVCMYVCMFISWWILYAGPTTPKFRPILKYVVELFTCWKKTLLLAG